MAIAHSLRRHRSRGWWMASNRIDAGDLRFAGGLMVLLALIRPLIPMELGVLCPLRAVTGVPCPFCGMTTSVTATVHLDLAEAFVANPAGIVAVGVALFLLIRRPTSVRVSMPFVLVSLGAMWAFELSRYGFI
ncbi:MAG: DUF2752 domain-containing protein [Acidimicrobiia bacterium]|nr:DUF2752 domain-containing protein [Acidimicrobiia bacterium]